MPVPCLRAGLSVYVYSLGAMEMCNSNLSSLSSCGTCGLCVVLVAVDRAFEPVGGSWYVRTFGRGILPAMAMMLYVARTPVLVDFIVPCLLPSRTALGCGHLRLDISVLPTHT